MTCLQLLTNVVQKFPFSMVKNKNLRIRCWIDVDGKKFFGPGPAELFTHIEECGSISEAAKKMKMSYKKAWDLINNINTQGQKPFVKLQKGGEKGGGATLTATGTKVVAEYRLLTKKLNAIIEKNQDVLKWI